MPEHVEFAHRRILLIDDNPAIHQDFGKIFGPGLHSAAALAESAAALFGEPADAAVAPLFRLDSASQGEEGLRCVCRARDENRPYSMAFVDMRMPPGWDGLETAKRIWERDPDIQIVVCTAYSDHTWEEIRKKLGGTDRLIILQKPFDNVEVLQLADALTEKWRLARQAECRLEDLERRVKEHTRELKAATAQLQGSNGKFRATITTVIAMSDLLLETALDPLQSGYAEIIRDSARAALTVINDKFDFAETGAGDLRNTGVFGTENSHGRAA